MAIGPSDYGLPERECARFAALCRRQGFRPEQFRIDADFAVHPVDAFAPMMREISITHIRYCCQRRYLADQLSDWLDAFEKDLRNGFFHAWYGYEWV